MKAGDVRRAAERDIDRIRKIGEMYALLQKLSKINGPKVSKAMLDRVIYRTEELPPLGKEYWWLLFFGKSGKRPVQLMLLVFRKYGKRMLFDGQEMALKGLDKDRFEAVTAGWVYDGKRMHDLGDTNALVEIGKKSMVSQISGNRLELSGGFPDYRLKVDGVLDLRISRSDFIEDRDAYGVFVPPFGMAWVDIFLGAEGTVLGRPFSGPAYLQKVFGVTIFGPFHWGRVVFEDDSVATFFALKTGKASKQCFAWYLTFHDRATGKVIRFRRPKVRVSKTRGGWVVEGHDGENDLRMVLKNYAKKEFIMKGGGRQVYIEYAVLPKQFVLKTTKRTITLKDLGKGVGTLEDAYW